MPGYIGDFPEDASVKDLWSSNNSLGGSVTQSSNGTVFIYKDLTTSSETTLGVTEAEDFDSLTGIHSVTVDTSAGAFYAVGSDYHAVLKSATIDGQTVSAPLFSFSIENRTTFPKADYPTNFASMGIESDGHVHGDVKQWVGNAVTASGGNPDVNVESIDDIDAPTTWKASINAEADTALSDYDPPTKAELDSGLAGLNDPTSGAIADAVWDELQSAHVGAGTFGEIATEIAAILNDTDLIDDGTSGLAKIATDVAAILTDTGTTLDNLVDDLESRLGTPTDLGGGATIALMLADMAGGTFATGTDSLEAIRNHIGDGTNLTEAGGDGDHLTEAGGDGDHLTEAGGTGDQFTALNDISEAEVNAQVDAAIETYHLDHLLAATYDPASKPGAADALLNEMVENDAGVSRFTANALEQAPTGGSAPTAADIADAVWDEAQSGHTSAGSFGEIATEIAAILNDTDLIDDGTSGLAKIATDVAAILTDTNELQTDDIPGAIAGLNDPTAATIADAVWDEAQSGHVAAGSFGELATEIAAILVDTGTTLDGKADAIKAVTDNLPDSGALTALLSNVAAILADTGTDGVVIAGTPDVNVAQVNSTVVQGDGTAGNKWRPA